MKKCKIDGCGAKYLARELCNKHYQRMQIHGDPSILKTRIRGGCSVPKCESPHYGLGFCIKHHSKIKKTGTLERIAGTPEYKKRISETLKSDLTILDQTKDPNPNRRGYLAVNVVNDIKYKARQRNKPWHLTNMEAYKLIIDSCHYCGFKPDWPNSRVGIDRMDNKKGYILENCVPCCFTCNSAKLNKTYTDFKAWILRIKQY